MCFDARQYAWPYDISSFYTWKNVYIRAITYPATVTSATKEYAMKRMKEIQSKYPQYIKLSEIPTQEV